MAISRLGVLCLLLLAAAAHGREAASPSACQAAGQQPDIAAAKAAVARAPGDVRANFALADAWSEAGCFSDAVQVLQAANTLNPDDPQLQTRLRVARSLVGEERFFDNIDRAEVAAKLKRNTFRCSSLADLEACSEASRLAPNDPAVMTAHGDALMRASRPAEAVVLYRHASALAPKQADLAGKIAAAETVLPAAVASAVPGPAQPAVAAIRAPAKITTSRRVATAAKVRLAVATPVKAAAARRFSNEVPDEAQSH